MPDGVGIAVAIEGNIPHPQRIETRFVGLGCNAELSIELNIGRKSRLCWQYHAE
jgi:hypothetical protein